MHTSPIREVQADAVVTADGHRTHVDTIILATGFAFSDCPVARRVWGAGGRSLAESWRDGPEAYLGISVAGFPNLFLLAGPNTLLGHSSVVFMIEAQLSYIGDCLRYMRTHRIGTAEVRREAQAAYNAGIHAKMAGTVWASGCASWYLDRAGRNRALWPGSTWRFRQLTRRFDPAVYLLGPGPPQPHPAAGSTPARASAG